MCSTQTLPSLSCFLQSRYFQLNTAVLVEGGNVLLCFPSLFFFFLNDNLADENRPTAKFGIVPFLILKIAGIPPARPFLHMVCAEMRLCSPVERYSTVILHDKDDISHSRCIIKTQKAVIVETVGARIKSSHGGP